MTTAPRPLPALATAALLAAFVAGCAGPDLGPGPWGGGKAARDAAGPMPPPGRGGGAAGHHLVRPGDTLSGLAARYGVTTQTLARANRLVEPYRIYAGQVLLVPGAAPAPPSSDGPVHVVQPGESLSLIAERHRLSTRDLAARNGIADPNRLRAGQRLRLPPGAAPPETVVAALSPPPRRPDVEGVAAPRPADGPPPALSGEGFLWPVEGRVIATFGPKPEGRRNDGINIAARPGAPVRAAEDGVVVYAGNELSGYGQMILLRHADNYLTTYAHNATLLVGLGDRVERGQVIARVGRSGNVVEPQLHFAIREGRRPIDPLALLVPSPTTVASSD